MSIVVSEDLADSYLSMPPSYFSEQGSYSVTSQAVFEGANGYLQEKDEDGGCVCPRWQKVGRKKEGKAQDCEMSEDLHDSQGQKNQPPSQPPCTSLVPAARCYDRCSKPFQGW